MIIATLIAADRLTQEHISAAAGALDAYRPASGGLAQPGSATDLYMEDIAAEQQSARGTRPLSDEEREAVRTSRIRDLRKRLTTMLPQVDSIVQPAEHRRKQLLVADMDSTMITVECIDELADYAGLKAEVAAITERAMRGELDFEAALDARVALLAGLDAETVDRCREERVRFTPGAKILVRTMKAQGATCILVSGGFTRFARPVGEELGFDRVIANELEIDGRVLTGRVLRPVVGAQTKRQVLVDAAAQMGIGLEQTLAVGDGANDLPMIEAAGLGVAYRAKPVLAEAADARIDHNDLTALLYAQGIPRAEWAKD